MWTTISTEQAQALFESSVDFQYRVPSSDSQPSPWTEYFHRGKELRGYLSPERVASEYKGTEFRVQTE